jgi:uncharacterized protein
MGDDAQTHVIQNPRTGRFELAGAPDGAYLEYRQAGNHLTLTHTEVDDELEGQGVGSVLVREALAQARDANLTVVPECGFVAGWLERHPERAAELDIASP